MDGSQRTVLVNTSLVWPNCLSLDLGEGLMYWADARLDKIEVAQLDGSSRRELLFGSHARIPHIRGLGILGDYIYWSDEQVRLVERMLKANGTRRETILEHVPDLMGIRVIDTTVSSLSATAPCPDFGCSHLCLPRPGTEPVCTCPPDMELTEDRKTCIVVMGYLLIAQPLCVQRVPLETYSQAATVIPANQQQRVSSMAVHYGQRKIFYADQEHQVVNWQFLDGPSIMVAAEYGLVRPVSIAVDWLSDNLYIADQARIEVARIDSSSMRLVFPWTDMTMPQSMAVYPEMGCLFWSDWTSDRTSRIDTATLDGFGRATLVSPDIAGKATSLAIDFEAARLYWVDITSRSIRYCSLMVPKGVASSGGGSIAKRLQCAQPQPLRALSSSSASVVSVYGNAILWYDAAAMNIQQAKGNYTTDHKIVVRNISSVSGLALFHHLQQPGYSSCRNNNGGCEHLCFTSVRKNAYFCACPSHYSLRPDNRTCSAPRDFLLISQTLYVSLISDPRLGLDSVLPIPGLHNITGMGYDLVDNMLYYVDAKDGAISRSYLNGSRPGVFLDAASPSGFGIDSYARILYWTDDQCGCIKAMHMNGRALGVIYGNGTGEAGKPRLRDMALLPEKGLMFFVRQSPGNATERVIRASMDGTNAAVVISSTSGQLVFAVDPHPERIYWSDSRLRIISSCDFDGTVRTVLAANVVIATMTVYGSYIYFVGNNGDMPGMINRIDKNSGQSAASLRLRVAAAVSNMVTVRSGNSAGVSHHPCKGRADVCSHICLASSQPVNGSFHPVAKCACPAGLTLRTDGRTCYVLRPCPAIPFSCSSKEGSCKLLRQRCSTESKMAAGSADADCSDMCAAFGLQQQCNVSSCIGSPRRCNAASACQHAYGHQPCSTMCCPAHQFMCANLDCIDERLVCDGTASCADGSDEDSCGASPLQEVLMAGAGRSDMPPAADSESDPVARAVTIAMPLTGVLLVFIVVIAVFLRRQRYRGSSVGLPSVGASHPPGGSGDSDDAEMVMQPLLRQQRAASTAACPVTTSSMPTAPDTVCCSTSAAAGCESVFLDRGCAEKTTAPHGKSDVALNGRLQQRTTTKFTAGDDSTDETTASRTGIRTRSEAYDRANVTGESDSSSLDDSAVLSGRGLSSPPAADQRRGSKAYCSGKAPLLGQDNSGARPHNYKAISRNNPSPASSASHGVNDAGNESEASVVYCDVPRELVKALKARNTSPGVSSSGSREKQQSSTVDGAVVRSHAGSEVCGRAELGRPPARSQSLISKSRSAFSSSTLPPAPPPSPC